MSKPIVIAFSGGCFSGKTTTMEKLKDTLEKKGCRVIMLSELVREHKIESIDELRRDYKKYLAFQEEVIHGKILAECHLLSDEYNSNDIVLVDRAITDSLFYLLFYVDKSKFEFDDISKFYDIQTRTMAHVKYAFDRIYDLVIEFEPISKPCEDTVYRPKQVGALKYVEATTISMLNEYANHGTLGKLIRWDLNMSSEFRLIKEIMLRFNL